MLRPTLVVAGLFSLFINAMLLGPILYMLQVFDRVLTSRSEPTLYMLTVVVGIALLAMALVDLARGRLMVLAGRYVDELLGERVLRHLVRDASALHRTAPLYGLRDIATLRSFLSGNNVIALFDAPWLLVFVALIFLFHPWMGFLAAAGAALLLALAWLNETVNRAALEQYQDAMRRSSQYMDQGLRNADVINSMGMGSRFAARWDSLNQETLDRMQATSAGTGAVLAASKFVRQSIQVAMMGLGVHLVIHDNLSPGTMIAGTILLGRALAPVESLIANWNGLVAARAAYRRLQSLFPVVFAEGARLTLPPPEGRLQAEQLILAGRDPREPILRQVTFDLPAGRSLGVLGPSGSGKTSLLKVLCGIWTPGAGQVRIDGAEVAHWDPAQLGPNIGYLPQDVELFPGTIAENIGRFDTSDQEAIIAAAQAAHTYDLVLRLPEGFDTRIGDGGIRLSAGQAQRIGLARALYGQPRIVLLDEPNANLDSDGETALLRTLEGLKATGTTLVLVTHKPSLIGSIDYLLVLREGRVELLGPRDEVLARLSGQNTSPPAPGASAGGAPRIPAIRTGSGT